MSSVRVDGDTQEDVAEAIATFVKERGRGKLDPIGNLDSACTPSCSLRLAAMSSNDPITENNPQITNDDVQMQETDNKQEDAAVTESPMKLEVSPTPPVQTQSPPATDIYPVTTTQDAIPEQSETSDRGTGVTSPAVDVPIVEDARSPAEPPPEQEHQKPTLINDVPPLPNKPNYKHHLTLSGHTMSISALKFSPTGSMLASSGGSVCHPQSTRYLIDLEIFVDYAGADKVIKLWDAYTGEILRTFEGHSLGISDIAWSGDEEYIASASDDKSIRIWSLDLVCLSLAHSALTVEIDMLNFAGNSSQDLEWSYKFRLLRQLQPPGKPPRLRGI